MSEPPDRIYAQYLRDQEILSAAEIQRLNHLRSSKTIGLKQALLEIGVMDEPGFLSHWAAMNGTVVLSAEQLTPEPEALGLVPREICVRYGVLPLRTKDGVLILASSDPTNPAACDDVRLVAGRETAWAAAASADIAAAIERTPSPETPPSDEDDSPVVREIGKIFDDALEQGASHIHLDPTDDGFVLLFRLEGKLREIRRFPKTLQPGLTARLKILAELDIAERRVPQSGRVRLERGDRIVEFGVATLPTAFHRERITLWALDCGAPIPAPEGLGFSDDLRPFFAAASRAREGLFLVAGTGGSGRTTTLYSIATALAAARRSVVSVESSVGRRVPAITQTEANPAAGIPLSRLLRHALRQDADVLLIDSLADGECLDLAVTAATRGKVVLAGTYSPSATDTLERLRDMGTDRYLLASALRAVLVQGLLPLLCPACKEPEKPSKETAKAVGLETSSIYKPRGCPACRHAGFKGCVPVGQILEMTDEWRRWLQRDAGSKEFPKAMKDHGREALRRAMLRWVSAGETSLSEALERS